MQDIAKAQSVTGSGFHQWSNIQHFRALLMQSISFVEECNAHREIQKSMRYLDPQYRPGFMYHFNNAVVHNSWAFPRHLVNCLNFTLLTTISLTNFMFSSFNSIHPLKDLDGDPGRLIWFGNTMHYPRSPISIELAIFILLHLLSILLLLQQLLLLLNNFNLVHKLRHKLFNNSHLFHCFMFVQISMFNNHICMLNIPVHHMFLFVLPP